MLRELKLTPQESGLILVTVVRVRAPQLVDDINVKSYLCMLCISVVLLANVYFRPYKLYRYDVLEICSSTAQVVAQPVHVHECE